MATTKKARDLKRGDLVDRGHDVFPVLRVRPDTNCNDGIERVLVDYGDTDDFHGSTHLYGADKELTVVPGKVKRLTRTPSALERSLRL